MKNIKETYETLEASYLDITSEFLELNDSNVEGALLRHSATYGYFAAVMSHAKRICDVANLTLDTRYAEVKDARRKEQSDNGFKVTEGSLTSYADAHSEIKDLKAKVVTSEHRYHLTQNLVKALDHQASMLIQLSSNRRAEVKMAGNSL